MQSYTWSQMNMYMMHARYIIDHIIMIYKTTSECVIMITWMAHALFILSNLAPEALWLKYGFIYAFMWWTIMPGTSTKMFTSGAFNKETNGTRNEKVMTTQFIGPNSRQIDFSTGHITMVMTNISHIQGWKAVYMTWMASFFEWCMGIMFWHHFLMLTS